jgi:hypothetical protein
MLQRNVIVAYGTVNIDQALAHAEERAAGGKPAIIVGIVRNPNGKCWWVCLARRWADITWVSVHRLKQQAEAHIALVERAARGGYLDDDAAFAGLVQELAAHGDDELQHTLVLARDMSTRPGQERALTDLLQALSEQHRVTRAGRLKSLTRQRLRTRIGTEHGKQGDVD